MCGFRWSGTHFIDQAGFEHIELSSLLGLQHIPPHVVYMVLETELRVSCVLGNQPLSTEQHSQL